MKRSTSIRTLYTIGHSTREASEVIEILRGSEVTRLIDIRSVPRSRTNPQFNPEALIETLRAAQISYCHLASLGGRRSRNAAIDPRVNAGWEHRAFHNYADYAETAPFRAGLARLLAMASAESCAIMCAEAVWWRCHRRIVTDHVLAHGVPVVHLLTRTTRQPAAMTAFAIVGTRRRVSYPGVPADP